MSAPAAVLVTGAGGFIGSHLCNDLVSDGYRVIGVDSGRASDRARLDPRVEYNVMDIGQVSAPQWRPLLEGVDCVFHLAAEKYNSSKSTPQIVIDTNISGTYQLAQAAADASVRKIVFTSSLYAYGSMGPRPMAETDMLSPNTIYGMSKAAGESILASLKRDDGPDFAVARLFFVYGPNQWADGGYKSVVVTSFERILRGESPVIVGDGRQQLDYIWIGDAVRALRQLARPEHSGLVVNIASGHGVEIKQLVDQICQASGYIGRVISAEPDWTQGSVRVGDTGRLKQSLGWVPDTPLIEGLRKVWLSMAEVGSS